MTSGSFLKRRQGFGLLILVLSTFVLLSILTIVIFSISMRTLNVEVWESKHYETLRLSCLARSAANAVVEAISDDVTVFIPSNFPINRNATTNITSINPTTLNIVISGDVPSRLNVKAMAANNKNQSVTVTVRYNNTTKKIIQQWRDDK